MTDSELYVLESKKLNEFEFIPSTGVNSINVVIKHGGIILDGIKSIKYNLDGCNPYKSIVLGAVTTDDPINIKTITILRD